MRIAWPERVALFLAVVLAVLLIGLGGMLNAGPNASPEWVEAGGQIWWHLVRTFLFPIWLLLRVIDLFGGGPARRRIRRTMEPPVIAQSPRPRVWGMPP